MIEAVELESKVVLIGCEVLLKMLNHVIEFTTAEFWEPNVGCCICYSGNTQL